MVRPRMAIALAGMLAAVTACATTPPQARIADEVAARLGARVASDLASGGTDANEPLRVLWRAVDELDPPEGVDALAPGGSGRTQDEEGVGVRAAVSVVVEPDGGAPYCIIVGVASDGATEGVPAIGDPNDDCTNTAPVGPTGDLLHSWPEFG